MEEETDITTTPLVHQGDDPLYVAAPSIDGNEDLIVPISDIDANYAGKLQLQEVLISSFQGPDHSTTTTPSQLQLDAHQRAPHLDETVIIDPKGKQVVLEEDETTIPPVAVFDRGQSSRDPSTMKLTYCGICMESKPAMDFFTISTACRHEFCEDCVRGYVAAKVEENNATIVCPDLKCDVGSLEPEACQGILRPELFEKWGMVLCEDVVGMKRFYCPFKDCSGAMMAEDGDGDVIRESECPHCHRLFCAQCRVPWHGDIECVEYQKLGEGEREREDLLLKEMAKSHKWQRCPKCGFYVERIDGCMFMKCRENAIDGNVNIPVFETVAPRDYLLETLNLAQRPWGLP